MGENGIGNGNLVNEDVKEDAETKKKKKKNKKRSKEALQKKKERKIHDVEGQFHGLSMPSFSGLALTSNSNFELSGQDSVKKGEKEVPYKLAKAQKRSSNIEEKSSENLNEIGYSAKKQKLKKKKKEQS